MTEEQPVALCEVRGCYEQATRFPGSGALKGGQYCLKCFRKPGLVKIDHFESLVVEDNPNYRLGATYTMPAIFNSDGSFTATGPATPIEDYANDIPTGPAFTATVYGKTSELQLSAEDISWLKEMAVTL